MAFLNSASLPVMRNVKVWSLEDDISILHPVLSMTFFRVFESLTPKPDPLASGRMTALFKLANQLAGFVFIQA